MQIKSKMPHSSNHPFLQQPPFPYDYPLLFVIPTGAERRGGICGAPFVCPASIGPQPNQSSTEFSRPSETEFFRTLFKDPQ
jgi:hypothetical protein